MIIILASMDWSNKKLEIVKVIKEKIAMKDKEQRTNTEKLCGNRIVGHMEIGKSFLSSISEASDSGLTQGPGSVPRHSTRTLRTSEVCLSVRGSASNDSLWSFCLHSECRKELKISKPL